MVQRLLLEISWTFQFQFWTIPQDSKENLGTTTVLIVWQICCFSFIAYPSVSGTQFKVWRTRGGIFCVSANLHCLQIKQHNTEMASVLQHLFKVSLKTECVILPALADSAVRSCPFPLNKNLTRLEVPHSIKHLDHPLTVFWLWLQPGNCLGTSMSQIIAQNFVFCSLLFSFLQNLMMKIWHKDSWRWDRNNVTFSTWGSLKYKKSPFMYGSLG